MPDPQPLAHCQTLLWPSISTLVFCDIVNYKKYIFGLWSHFWHRTPKNPWNFLSEEGNKSVFCSAKEGLLEVPRRLELSAPPPWLLRREKSWKLDQWPRANDLIKHAYVMKLHKPPKDRVWRASGLNMWSCRENDVPGEGMGTPCPMHLFHLAVPERYSFSKEKLIIDRKSVFLSYPMFSLCRRDVKCFVKQYNYETINLSSDQKKCKLNSKGIRSKWHTEYICLPYPQPSFIEMIEN